MNQEIIALYASSNTGICHAYLGAKQLGEMERDVVHASCKLVDINDYKIRGIEPYLRLIEFNKFR